MLCGDPRYHLSKAELQSYVADTCCGPWGKYNEHPPTFPASSDSPVCNIAHVQTTRQRSANPNPMDKEPAKSPPVMILVSY